MNSADSSLSTGLPGLDNVLQGIIAGDNIVWKVDGVENYQAFVDPFYRHALAQGRKVVYFRFASHKALIPEDAGAEIHYVAPSDGFELFITKVHDVIERNGRGGFYVFDSLSALALECYSDRMVGNFFMLTCPYLLKQGAVAYFAVLRNYHSFHAAAPIAETTQIFIDVYRYHGEFYIHPQKVFQRYSPTIHMLHIWRGDQFLPVTHSAVVAEVLTSVPWTGLESASYQVGVWNREFLHAEEVWEEYKRGECSSDKVAPIFQRLLRMAISREEKILRLAEQYLNLGDLLRIRKRMIGTGYIGGKSVGMLISRQIMKMKSPRWEKILEAHDSFYIASEVFYTYLVLNDCWWARKKQKDPSAYLDGAEEAQRRILQGHFPDYIIKRFENMLDYYGQSPIIVRSSSLLEDSYGNMFAGKYESVFCANQGSRAERLERFVQAVKTIYASSMGMEVISYRARRGNLEQDEQMALLVQRVSGARYGDLFYPQIAGVGLSYNPYAWSEIIKPEAGALRLVFGLGSRAVTRNNDDYARLVALNAPDRRPETGQDEIRRYSQRKVDVLNLKTNQLTSVLFSEAVEQSPGLMREFFAIPDEDLLKFSREMGKKETWTWLLSFQRLLDHEAFLNDMREMLKTLAEAYLHPVDIEFTVNFIRPDSYKINLLQCRPFQFKGGGAIKEPPAGLSRRNVVIEAQGAVIGESRADVINRIVYVDPDAYGRLPINERYSIARLIGKTTRPKEGEAPKITILIGPGRWGTTTPSLGIPVSFSEIDSVSILCEINAMREDLTPDISLGTHFFSSLVEMEILYFALFPEKEENFLNRAYLLAAPNRLTDIVPSSEPYAEAVKLIDLDETENHGDLRLYANTFTQKVVCYFEPE
ncbi:MAG: PEP/pyruvate-binding domain-containing protein [Candidatus Omnitrophota bacterium]